MKVAWARMVEMERKGGGEIRAAVHLKMFNEQLSGKIFKKPYLANFRGVNTPTMADVHVASANADLGSAAHSQLLRAGWPMTDPGPVHSRAPSRQECCSVPSSAVLG